MTSRTGASFRPAGFANPINDKGQVAGSTQVGDHRRAAIFDTRNRSMRVLETAGNVDSYATDINRYGDASGYTQDAAGASRAFFWPARSRSVRVLDSLGGASSAGHSINDRGLMVGYVVQAGNSYTAVLWNTRTGAVRDLGGDQAIAINNRGWVVGIDDDDPDLNQRPVLWRPGDYAEVLLPLLPGNDAGYVHDINDAGDVAGEQFSLARDDLVDRPVVWSGRTSQPCMLTKAEGNGSAFAINNHGRVVGNEVSYAENTSRTVTWKTCGRPGTTLPEIAGAGALASGINDRGLIIGRQYEGPLEGVRWDRR